MRLHITGRTAGTSKISIVCDYLFKKYIYIQDVQAGVPTSVILGEIGLTSVENRALHAVRAKKLANIRAKLKPKDRRLYGKLHNVDRLSCLIRMDNNGSIVYHNLNDIDNLSDSLIIIADKSMLDNFLK